MVLGSVPFPEFIKKSKTKKPRSSSPITLEHKETDGAEDENEQHQTPLNTDWVIYIGKRLDKACKDGVATTWSKNKFIYKVPQHLKRGDVNSYMPHIVSIGPYHHGKKRTRRMEKHKWWFLQLFLKRPGNDDVKEYLKALKKVEDRIRACYEGRIDVGSDEFVQMMLLDGCFILELFQGAAEGSNPVFAMRTRMDTIQRDLILLENQLPLFVLDRLLGIQRGQPELKGDAAKLALKFFKTWTPTYINIASSMESSKDSLHCLEVFRRGLLRYSGPDQPESTPRSNSDRVASKRQQLQWIHCVTVLRDEGVKFMRRHSIYCFWEVKFKNGVLKIPKLLIDDGTKSLFLNLIAFEQCHPDCSSDITSYVMFMDNLINSAADVGYLHKCGIIEHRLCSDAEVADMFNNLCQEVVLDTSDSYLSTLSSEVNTYYHHLRNSRKHQKKKKWNSWLASLKHNYFSNPWSIISLFAAVTLLLLTLAQTIYTVYGYYRPRGN